MKKLVVIGNILSAIPALIVLPLAPFVFILVNNEGKIPGYTHEYLTQTLAIIYPLSVLVCLFLSIKLFKNKQLKPALWTSLLPLVIFTLLFCVFYFGGVTLR